MVKKLISWILFGALLLSLVPLVHATPRAVVAEGIDVSYAQGKIDWDTAAKYVDFVIIRCGYGQDRTSQDDEYWFRNVEACTRLGIPFGVYLFSHADTDAKARSEAAHVLRLLKGYSPSLPVFLDVESKEIAACSNADILRHITIFCDIISEAGYTPGIYSNSDWWDNRLSSPEYHKWERWVAQWNNPPGDGRPHCAWQYTNEGKIPGINGFVDRDCWYGLQANPECSHNYSSQVTKAPTCTQEGIRKYTCIFCKHSYEEKIAAKGHIVTETITPPSCATDGARTITCINCGFTVEERIPAEGHIVSEIITPPTCTEVGIRKLICITCGYIYEEILPAKGHSLTETGTPPTCTTEGVRKCTCTTCGYFFEEILPATEHSFTEAGTPPTCTTAGVRKYFCVTCGHYYEEILPPTGHNLTTLLTPPTCTAKGVNKVSCTNCDYGYDEILPATGHNLIRHLTPPTCTDNGVNKVSCTNCAYGYDELLPPKGHSFTETVIPPTCEYAGYTIFTCACGYCFIGDDTSCTGHMSDRGTIVKMPTEKECGEKVYQCMICGELLRRESLPSGEEHRAQCASASFGDVPPYLNWAHEGIDFCVKEGLFRGVGQNCFDPEGVMTRAMLVTVLWRFEGCPMAEFPCDFVDVEQGDWYADAVAWAQETALVKGVGEKRFDPMREITREQFATILYRRSITGVEGEVPEGILEAFPDAEAVSDYARISMAWAVHKGYINGTAMDGRVFLDPRGVVTRAQAATIIQRLAQS